MKTMKLYKVTFKSEEFELLDEVMVLAPDPDYAIKVCQDDTGIYNRIPVFDEAELGKLTVEEICGTDAEQPKLLLVCYDND